MSFLTHPQVAKDYEAYFIKLAGMFQLLGHALPRIQTYERLFPAHGPLSDSLLSIYLQIIQLLISFRKVFEKSTFKVIGRILWKSVDQTFDECILRINELSDQIERQANLAHMVEEANARAELNELKIRLEKNESLRGKSLQVCECTQFSLTKLEALRDASRWLAARQCHEEKGSISILEGTCEWMLSRPEVARWISDPNLQQFWLIGPPGCGKSSLYTKLVDHLALDQGKDCTYFLFCGADRERVTCSALLRSWASQLSKLSEDAKRILSDAFENSDKQEATEIEVEQLFFSILEVSPSVILTVDALDECTEQKRVEDIITKISLSHKVLVTTRRFGWERENEKISQNRHILFEIQPEMTKGDINMYISSSIKRAGHNDPKMASLILQKLSLSNGMFLWVRLMMENIEEQTTEAEVLHCLRDSELPAGLFEYYDLMMDRINKLPKSRRLLALKVFFWIDVARRPLGATEISDLLAVLPSQDNIKGFDRSRCLSGNPRKAITSACGSLVSVRGTSGRLYPTHFTVTEYIRKYLKTNDVLNEITGFYDSRQLKTSDSLAAAVCIRYLSLETTGDFTVSTSRSLAEKYLRLRLLASEPDILGYTATSWQYHLKKCHAAEDQPPLSGLIDELLHTNQRKLNFIGMVYAISRVNEAFEEIEPRAPMRHP